LNSNSVGGTSSVNGILIGGDGGRASGSEGSGGTGGSITGSLELVTASDAFVDLRVEFGDGGRGLDALSHGYAGDINFGPVRVYADGNITLALQLGA